MSEKCDIIKKTKGDTFMIYCTGDTHGDWSKFSTNIFPEQKEMSRDDFVIICGDFGLWKDNNEEKYWLNWLNDKPFTTLFVDGNHENYTRLNSEFETVDFHGGKAHKIRDNIYHLKRGYVFDICDKKIFAFGGAKSHDITDGILEPADFKTEREFNEEYKRWSKANKMFRVNNISWWKEEMPTEEEMIFGLNTLAEHNYEVDFIITHCAPQQVVAMFSDGCYKSDELTEYFDIVNERVKFKKWFFGHYHDNKQIMCDFVMLYEQIIRIA